MKKYWYVTFAKPGAELSSLSSVTIVDTGILFPIALFFKHFPNAIILNVIEVSGEDWNSIGSK